MDAAAAFADLLERARDAALPEPLIAACALAAAAWARGEDVLSAAPALRHDPDAASMRATLIAVTTRVFDALAQALVQPDAAALSALRRAAQLDAPQCDALATGLARLTLFADDA